MANESTGIKGFVTSFDPQQSKFALVSADGRLKIWDVTTGKLQQEINTSNHLSDDYTCIAWGNNSRSSNKQAKKSKVKNDLIALGTSKGDIHLINYATATVVPLGGSPDSDEHLGHKQKVNDLEFSEDGNLLYSCSDDKQIIVWETNTGSIVDTFKAEKEPIYSIKLYKGESGGMLASAGHKIKVFDLTSKKVEHKYSGHTAPVSDLVFIQHSLSKVTYLLSCSSDRFVYMWSLSSDSQHSPIRAFACDSSSLMLDAINITSEDGVPMIEIMGLSEAGIVNIWSFQGENNNSAKGKDKKMIASLPASKVELKTKGKEEGEIIGARFTGDLTQLSSSKRKLAVSYFPGKYQTSKPYFELLEYTSNDGKLKKTVTIEVASESSETKTKKSKEVAISSTILGVTDMPLPTSVSTRKIQDTEENNTNKRKKVKEEKEITAMEEEEGKGVSMPKVQSLKQVLIQALHSNDSNLLESCLHTGDLTVINNTVAKLPPHYVLKFLKVIVERFQAKPTRGTELILWMKSLLVYHSSYLITIPDLVKNLSSLYLAVDSRLSLYKKMIKLSGRLDLLLTQVKENKVSTNYVANSVFTEEDDEEEENDLNESDDEQDFGDNEEPLSDNENANGENESEEEKGAS